MDNMFFDRELNIKDFKSSIFLFGPRMTGKSVLLETLDAKFYFDLLDPENELKYRKHPKLFYDEIKAISQSELVIVDEIQRVPSLLDYVQMGIQKQNLQFILSGSSARKLKRGAANLLGGRALDLKMHPLTYRELGNDFNISEALMYGTLPKVSTLIVHDNNIEEAKLILKSYVSTYIKKEIQEEALVRNVGNFQRFLDIAAHSNAQMIEFSNISREASVSASTVKGFFSILEDTLLGRFLWPHDRSERKKARPKFYFFDTGVLRSLQERLSDYPTPQEKGFLFETWFFNELIRLRDYHHKEYRLSLWRKDRHEIDFVISKGNRIILGIECKTGNNFKNLASISSFKKAYPDVPIIISSLDDTMKRKRDDGLEIYPWKEALSFIETI